MKVLLLDTGKEWGGGTNSLLALLRGLDRSRFDVTCVFYTEYAGLRAALDALNIPLWIVPQRRQPLWAKLSKELARGVLHSWPTPRAAAVAAIERRWRQVPAARALAAMLADFDVLYMNNQPESNLEGYWAAQWAGVPVVQHCRTRPTLSAAAVAAANQAAQVIAVSPSVAQHLQHCGVAAEHITVVLNGIDLDTPIPDRTAARAALGIAAAALITVVVASLLPRKGVADVIRALPEVPETLLYVVGEGPERTALHDLAHSLGVSERVVFVGFSTQVLQWMAAADVVALASESEGLPRVLLEAMLCGRPVVASKVSGSQDVVEAERTGYLFPYGDVNALAAAWRHLATHAELRAQMGQAGQARVRAQFGLTSYIEGVQTVLSTAGRRGGSPDGPHSAWNE